ncbi:MAG: type IV secretion system DNA-binding domain-containing protein [Fimbriimonadaceae bacterium]|nr:type IV secretion system DNA-binding domain-containing protein [Alphaproteobacteria bacterium]
MESDIIIGSRNVWGNQLAFGVSSSDRHQHLYLIGQTGTGKSTLLESLLAQDIRHGAGCALLDPHGDLAEAVLHSVPPHRIDDVVLMRPGDLCNPVAWNPFYRVPEDQRALAASNITSALRHVWRDSWGPRLEYVLYNAIAATLDAPDSLRPTFLSIPRLLVDERYRGQMVETIRDPQVRFFWTQEFASWSARFLDEALSPVQNKIGALLSAPALRNILGQWHSTIDIAKIMESGKIFLVDLSRGTLGEDKANLLGSLLVASFQAAAMGRANLPAAQRADFHLYVDEFHCFGTDIFVSILSEARKFGLTLALANQYLAQLPEPITAAVLGNVANLVCFRTGAEDAHRLARELGDFAPSALSGLNRGEVCARLLRNGESGQAFLGRTTLTHTSSQSNRATITAQSRQRYSRERRLVEARISKWLQTFGRFQLNKRRESR